MVDGVKKIRVLCVDDSAADRLLIRHALEKESQEFQMTEAADAAAFEQLLSKGDFDVVLTDFNILGFEGLEVMRRVKSRYPQIPVILVTGTGSEEIAVKALKEGADDYVIKTPHHIAQLPHTIHMTIDVYQRSAELREAQERFRRMAENSPDIIYRYRLSPQPGFEYVSPASARIVGYTPEEHYADPDLGLKFIHPDDRSLLESIRKGREYFLKPVHLRWIHKDGHTVWTEQINIPIYDENGNLIAIEGTARDITEKKQAEEKLAWAFKDNQMLLEELYGRINNALQMMISFIELRVHRETDENILLLLKELESKIQALALVHRRLYESKNLRTLDITNHIENIIHYIRQDFPEQASRIRIEFAGTPLNVSMDAAAKLGFVYTELLTNALIHGFPQGRRGTIQASINRSPKDDLILEIADNGVGLEDSFDPLCQAKLGLELARQIVQEGFAGKFELVNRRGVHWKITIPKEEYQPKERNAE